MAKKTKKTDVKKTESKKKTTEKTTRQKKEVKKEVQKPKPAKKQEVNLWKTASGILFVALMFVVAWSFTRQPVQPQTQDELIFISSKACSICGNYNSTMQEIARMLDVPYKQVEFINPVSFPGFVLIKNNTLSISGFENEEQLYQLMCMITSDEEVCAAYRKLLEESTNKTEKPVVKFFVMSFCPFGQQMESVIYPVYQKFKELASFEPHYVIYSNYGDYNTTCIDKDKKYCSMHGLDELIEDVRQLCIHKYYPMDVWWNYVMYVDNNCSLDNINTCWKDAANHAGVDTTKVEQCVKEEATQLLEKELQLNAQYDVKGSPTVFINDQLYRDERTPDAFQQSLCRSFITPPEECNTSVDASATSAASAGSCG